MSDSDVDALGMLPPHPRAVDGHMMRRRYFRTRRSLQGVISLRPHLARRLKTLLLTAAVLCLAQYIAPGRLAYAIGTMTWLPPTLEGQATRVKLGIFVVNLAGLDEVTQQFTFKAYMRVMWNDSRLKFSPAAGESGVRRYQPDEVWHPILEFANATQARQTHNVIILGTGDGNLTYLETFAVTLAEHFRLRPFPFDDQDLEIVIHPFIAGSSQVSLSVDPVHSGYSSQRYAALPLRDIRGFRYGARSEIVGGGLGEMSTVHFTIGIERHYSYYIWKIFLPLLLMVIISWTALFVPPDDLNNMILISLTTILTLIAFSFSVAGVLPRVPHLTFYDGYFLACYFFVLLSVFEVMMVHLTSTRRSKERAQELRKVSRWALPCGFIAVDLLIWWFFVIRVAPAM
jgi:hypothetical protein